MDAGAQAPLRRGLKGDLAAVTARHVAGNRQAETDPSSRRIARWIEPDECTEGAVPIRQPYPRSVVVDQDVDPIGDHDPAQPDMTAVATRIVDQVTDATTQRVGSHQYHV